MALSVLITNSYGTIDAVSGIAVCSFGGSLLYGNTIHSVIYDGFALLNFAVMTWFLFQLYTAAKQNPELSNSKAYSTVLRALWMYPIALIVCWTPHSIYEIVDYCTTVPDETPTGPVVDSMKILHGGVVALIFFRQSKEARLRWFTLASSLWFQVVLCRCWCPLEEEMKPSVHSMQFRPNNILPPSENISVSESTIESLDMNDAFRLSSSDVIAPFPGAINDENPSVGHSLDAEDECDWPRDSDLVDLFAKFGQNNVSTPTSTEERTESVVELGGSGGSVKSPVHSSGGHTQSIHNQL